MVSNDAKKSFWIDEKYDRTERLNYDKSQILQPNDHNRRLSKTRYSKKRTKVAKTSRKLIFYSPDPRRRCLDIGMITRPAMRRKTAQVVLLCPHSYSDGCAKIFKVAISSNLTVANKNICDWCKLS